MILIYDNSVSTLVHLFLSYDTAVVHLRGYESVRGEGGGMPCERNTEEQTQISTVISYDNCAQYTTKYL